MLLMKNNRPAFVGMVQCRVQSGPDGLPPNQTITESCEFIKAARKMLCNLRFWFAVVSLYCTAESEFRLAISFHKGLAFSALFSPTD